MSFIKFLLDSYDYCNGRSDAKGFAAVIGLVGFSGFVALLVIAFIEFSENWALYRALILSLVVSLIPCAVYSISKDKEDKRKVKK